MSFDLSLEAPHRIRQFCNIVSCAARLCDAVIFDVNPDGMTVRGLSSSQAVHFSATIPKRGFDTLAVAPTALPARPGGGLGDQDVAEITGEPVGQPTYPCTVVPSKALFATMLRSASYSVSKFCMTYDSGSNVGMLSMHVHSANGIAKHYAIHLDSREVRQASANDEAFTFDAAAEARVWSGIFAGFSGSASQVCVTATPSRLTMHVVDSRIDAHALTGNGDKAPVGTLTSIEPRNLARYRHPQRTDFSAQNRRDPLNSTSGLLSAAPTQQPSGQAAAPDLPPKTFEFRPMRTFAFFADSLQHGLRLRLGGAGVPVQLEAIPRSELGSTNVGIDVALQNVSRARQLGAGIQPSMEPPLGPDSPLPIQDASLLIAAVDDTSNAPAGAPSTGNQGVSAVRESVSHAPHPAPDTVPNGMSTQRSLRASVGARPEPTTGPEVAGREGNTALSDSPATPIGSAELPTSSRIDLSIGVRRDRPSNSGVQMSAPSLRRPSGVVVAETPHRDSESQVLGMRDDTSFVSATNPSDRPNAFALPTDADMERSEVPMGSAGGFALDFGAIGSADRAGRGPAVSPGEPLNFARLMLLADAHDAEAVALGLADRLGENGQSSESGSDADAVQPFLADEHRS